MDSGQVIGELPTACFWHDHIGRQQVNRSLMILGNLEGFTAVSRL